MASLSTQQDEYFFERILTVGCWREGGSDQLSKGEGCIGHEFGWHFGRWQFVINQAGGHGTARHVIEFARVTVLDHDHAACGFDSAHAQRAVTAGAREHDANRLFTQTLRQGSEEVINRQSLAAWCSWFQ